MKIEENLEEKNGFKETKLGWIPEDWEIKEINKKIELSKDRFDPRKESDFFKCIELENINKETYSINGYFDSRNQKSNKNVFRRGDILFGKLRPNLRKYWLAEFDGVCSTEIWVLRGKAKELDNFFLGYFVQQERFYLISNVTSGSKMPRADWKFVQNYPMLFPPIKEQKAIADCLGIWDKAITKLTNLITAKETQKKALMQQLLTGKKRLPGFRGEWEKVGAGELFESISLKNNPNEELLSVTQDKGVIPRSLLDARVTMPSGNMHTFKLVNPGNFVISLRSFQGGLEFSSYRGLVSPAYTVLQEKKNINNDFFRFYFKSYEFIERLSIAVIGIRDGKQISYSDFCTVKIPNIGLEEQTAIANILNTADKEIQLLKAKLEQLKHQKKGLMQQLLTGKKRLKYEF